MLDGTTPSVRMRPNTIFGEGWNPNLTQIEDDAAAAVDAAKADQSLSKSRHV